MASKTRERLIEVARQLFVRKGLDNTTMNDIATASAKGRRTIYTYFKNKREIYDAVLESESENIVAELRTIVDNATLTCLQKMECFLRVRYLTIEANQSLYSQVKSFFTRDYRRLERIRQLAYKKEGELLCRLLDEGVAQGEFDPGQAQRMRGFASTLSRTADMTMIDMNTEAEAHATEASRHALIAFIINGLKKQ